MRKEGTVREFRESFGFIKITYKQQYFFHVSQWDSVDLPEVGQRVSFEEAPPRKPGAYPCAVNVQPIGGQEGGL
jgi:cold shock CspA family protein